MHYTGFREENVSVKKLITRNCEFSITLPGDETEIGMKFHLLKRNSTKIFHYTKNYILSHLFGGFFFRRVMEGVELETNYIHLIKL